MATNNFNINLPSVSLNQDERLVFKLVVTGKTTNNFTASFSSTNPGSLKVSSLAASTGYASTVYSYFDSASLSASAASAGAEDDNEITFSTGISNFHNKNYLFIPNPLTGSQNSLYDIYGDVDYKFSIKPYDIILTYLLDGTYIESRILSVYTTGSLLRVKIDAPLSSNYRNNLIDGTYQRFLLLTRIEDESNAYINFRKRPGPTSYGLAIPSNIHPDVLNNIDIITKEIKQKLVELGGIDGGTL